MDSTLLGWLQLAVALMGVIVVILLAMAGWMLRIDRFCTRAESEFANLREQRVDINKRLSGNSVDIDKLGDRLKAVEVRMEHR